MGVYIKGIEMPKNCFDCEIFGLCSLKDRLEHIKDRNPDCPLVEIPTPHGRLIDRDAVPEVSADPLEEAGFQGVLDDMPVFLEAEGRS